MITYEKFLVKSCNSTRTNTWSLTDLKKFCIDLNIRYQGITKTKLCAKLFKHFFMKIKENPQGQAPNEYRKYSIKYNTESNQNSIISNKLLRIPRFNDGTFYDVEGRIISTFMLNIVRPISKLKFIEFCILLDCIQVQIRNISLELDIAVEVVENAETVGAHVTSNTLFVPAELLEEDSDEFINSESNIESIDNDMDACLNNDVITLEPYDINSSNIFTIYYLNSQNKFNAGSCVSKSEMKEYMKSEKDESPSLLSTIWKGGDITGIGGKPTCKFIVKMPPNNIWITLGSFDRMMNSNEKNWYLLPLYGNKRRRIGYNYGVGANHGQIPGSYIYKSFTKEEIKNNIEVKETDYDFPLYVKDLTLSELDTSKNIIKGIKNHFV